jgi:hypothetical protein
MHTKAILRLKAEIICKHFTPEMILRMSNAQFYQDYQNQGLVAQAMELLKDEEQYEWRVKVQADSLGQVDYASQKQEKVEFTNAVATFLQSASTTIKAMPPSAPIVFETLKFAISGFKGASELEGVIDAGIQQITAEIQEQKKKAEQAPNPEQQKMQAEMQMEQQRFQMEQQTKQMDMQMKQQEQQAKLQMEREKMAMDMEAKQQDLAFKQQEHAMNMQMNREKFDAQVAQDSAKAMQQMELNARKEKDNAQD